MVRWLLAAVVILPCLVLADSSPASKQKAAATKKENTAAAPSKPKRKPALSFQGPRKADRGDLRLRYDSSEDLGELRDTLRETKLFDEIVRELNRIIAMPSDVAVIFTDCGEANAFYDPEKRRILMCYEIIAAFAEALDDGRDEEELGVAILGATIFTFLHELGHALVHVLEIPVTGKEEDAVDDLAALMLVVDEDGTGGVDEENPVLGALEHFYLSAERAEDSLDELPFWDEHSLDAQRFYNLACIVYGSDPEGAASFVEDGVLPEERAVRCPAEFEQKSRSWSQLLGPHLKD